MGTMVSLNVCGTLGVVEDQHARDKEGGVLTQIQGMLSG